MQIKGVSPVGSFARGGLGLTAFFAFALWLSGCSNPGLGSITVCGTEVQDPFEVAGCVEHENGETAIGVRVTAIPKGGGISKVATLDSAGLRHGPENVTVTDDNGLYKFRGLPRGEYTLFFDYFDEADSARIQSHRMEGVYVHPKVPNPLGKTRLQPASKLLAVVFNRLDGKEVVGAVCHIENTSYGATTDELGILQLYGLPGTYFVRCEKGSLLSQPYKVTLDSGRNTYERIPMSEGGQTVTIPVPTNVVAILDSITGIVRVSWSKPITNELFQYRIRRVEIEKTDLLIGWEGVTDTIQYDPVFAGEPDTVTSKRVQYNVVSKRGIEYSEAVSSKAITVVRGPSAKVGFLDTAQTSCLVGDTAKLLGTYKSRLNHNARVLWTTRSALDTLQDTRVDNRQGSDTLSYPCLAPGEPSVEFRVKDETGITSITRFKFAIVSPP